MKLGADRVRASARKEAGLQFETNAEGWTDLPRDVWLKPFDWLQGEVEDRLNVYLTSEMGLLDKLEGDGFLPFVLPANAREA